MKKSQKKPEEKKENPWALKYGCGHPIAEVNTYSLEALGVMRKSNCLPCAAKEGKI